MLFIFIRTKSNERASLPVGGTVGQEIQSAVQAGKEVTVHEKPISAHGFTGYGYTITDPETGAGAYLIEGKGNGAYWKGFAAGRDAAIALAGILITIGTGPVGVFLAGLIAAVILASLAPVIMAVKNMNADERACFFSGFGTGFALAGLLAGFVMMGLNMVVGLAFSIVSTAIGVSVGEYVNTTPGYLCRKG